MHEKGACKSNTIHIWQTNCDFWLVVVDFLEPIENNQALNNDSKKTLDQEITVADWALMRVILIVSDRIDIILEVQFGSSLLHLFFLGWSSLSIEFLLILNKL